MQRPASREKHVVTRDDVARLAGVSTALVSYVVNGGPRAVSPANEAKVRQAITALGYRPNAAARALALGSSEMLGMIVPDVLNPFYASVARAVEIAAEKRGYTLLLSDSQDSLRTERRLIKNFAARRVDGLFLSSVLIEPDLVDLVQETIPVVLLNHPTQFGAVGSPTTEYLPVNDLNADSVGVAFEAGARAAVEHLVGHGHERIGLVIGHSGENYFDAREMGWEQALTSAGLTRGPTIRVPFSFAGGYQAGLEFMARSERPTALFISSDQQAIGFMSAVQEAGWHLPQDLAIFSFDGAPESEYTWPRLSTVAQPVTDLAEAAVDVILGPRSVGQHQTQIFPTKLVVRKSCGCE